MNLIVIPARANSKRLKNKNIKKINNKPLIKFVLDVLEKNKLKEKIYITSDSEQIKKIVKDYKKVLFIKRPRNLAKDSSTVEDAVIHLIKSEKLESYKWVITIQPNSPFIGINEIKKVISLTKKTKANCIMTVNKNYTDLWVKDNTNPRLINRLFKNAPRRSQLRSPVYEENSAVYATRISHLLKTGKIFDKKNEFIELSRIEGLDINDITDFRIAKSLLEK